MENEQPKDDDVGEPEGAVTGTDTPSRWSRLTRRVRWWLGDVKRSIERKREVSALLPILRHGTEKELRECKVPFPRSWRDVERIVEAVTKREHHYGTCVYAMSIAAEASFNYVAHVLGTTGFQSSCADLDFLRRTRLLEHGFQIIKYDDLLYPQYADKFPTRAKVLRDNIDELGKAAEKKLADTDRVHPEVKRWWEDLVDMRRVHLQSARV